MAGTDKTETAGKADGQKLFDAVLAAGRAAKLGAGIAIVEHKDGIYARLQLDGATRAYVVRSKTMAHVYPNSLAAEVKKASAGLTFKKVALGSHHYGKGEVVVAVVGEGDVANAVEALRASIKAEPVTKPKAKKAPAAPAKAPAKRAAKPTLKAQAEAAGKATGERLAAAEAAEAGPTIADDLLGAAKPDPKPAAPAKKKPRSNLTSKGTLEKRLRDLGVDVPANATKGELEVLVADAESKATA